MNFKQISNSLFFFALIITLISSCKKFVEIKPGTNLVESDAVFSNDKTAISAMLGVYGSMNTNLRIGSSGLPVYTGLAGDELYNPATNATADPFYKNSILPTDPTISLNFWNFSFQNIYRVNAILEGLQSATQITDTVKNQLIGEAKFVRALYYFYLLNLFGEVPLITTTDYRINAIMPRSPINDVYLKIKTDLLEAQSLLKLAYPSYPVYSASGRVRPNKWTATALLARVYLFQRDWANAEIQASLVINSAMYNLTTSPNLSTMFQKNGNESIWEITNDVGNTTEGSTFIPSSTTRIPTYVISNYLLGSFEAGDLRKKNWLDSNKVNTIVYYYPKKYKVRSSTVNTENDIVFRLGEQYLIRAEARAQQNIISGSQDDLNKIRNRAGLLNTAAATKDSLLAAIEHERYVELFTEWGHRWLDLKRTSRVDAVLGIEKAPNWQTTDALWPIPYTELQRNVFLTQNMGY